MHRKALYIGTHRRAHHADPNDIAFGIYRILDGSAGAECVVETPQPGWIAVHPNMRVLYAVNEVRTYEGEEGGAVSAFEIAADGSLAALGSRRTPPMPCHCEIDATGRYLVVATFGGGSVHLFPLEADGAIGPEADMHRHAGSSIHPRRQTHPHAHAANIDPANRFVLCPDLGTDEVLVYELDLEAGRLVPRPERTAKLPPGSGPRHLAFSRAGRFVYLMNEMTATVTAFAFDRETGALGPLQSVDLLPRGFEGLRSGAAIALHPSGRFLFGTTRSHGSSGEPPVRGLDSLVWFCVDERTGLLEPGGSIPSGGEIPRSFTFTPEGDRLLIAHQATGNVVAFAIDPVTGEPRFDGDTGEVPVPTGLCFAASN